VKKHISELKPRRGTPDEVVAAYAAHLKEGGIIKGSDHLDLEVLLATPELDEFIEFVDWTRNELRGRRRGEG